ncbi:MAG: hypothetical protein CMH30_03710 [Micavibrio sp.]|nr:hypothetical protein [Micavibrio sp.]
MIREEGVQAVVWLRDTFKAAASYEDLAYIYKEITKKTDVPLRFTLLLAFVAYGHFNFTQDMPLLSGCSDHDFIENIALHFTKAEAKIKAHQSSDADAHVDGTKTKHPLDDSLLFLGLYVRILEFHGFPGTNIYDPAEIDPSWYDAYLDKDFCEYILSTMPLPEPWQVKGSDVLFLTNKSWPKSKVCLHGEPFYDSEISRVVSIYDVRHYIPKTTLST